MKRLLQFGFVLGFALTLAAGWFLPWIGYQRYPSVTTAVMNGGRGERFLIRLPNDRIYAAGNTAATLGVPASPVRRAYPPESGLGGTAASAVEHYKLRDVDGNVIGVATRHATAGEGSTPTAWLISLPSRGAIAFGGTEAGIDQVEAALAGQRTAAGTAFANPVSVKRLSGVRSTLGTREFQRIDFVMDETWEISGVDTEGRLQGTITLETVGRTAQ